MTNSKSRLRSWIRFLKIEKLIIAMLAIAMAVIIGYWLNGLFKPEVVVMSGLFMVITMIYYNLCSALALSSNPEVKRSYLLAKGVNRHSISCQDIKTGIRLFGLLAIISFALLVLIAKVSKSGSLILGGCVFYFLASNYIFSLGRKSHFTFLKVREISIFIYLGIWGVMGNIYIYSGEFNLLSLLPAFGFGFFSIALFNIDFLRASKLDKFNNDPSLVSMMSEKRAKLFHSLVILLGFVCYLFFTYSSMDYRQAYTYIVCIPLFLSHLIDVFAKGNRVSYFKAAGAVKSIVTTLNICFIICMLFVIYYFQDLSPANFQL